MALLLLVIGILFFLTARHADKLADPFIRSLLEQNKPMNHRIDFRKINVNLISRSINIKDARIYPDSSLVKDSNIWIAVNVDLIKLTGFNIKKLLLEKILIVGDLVLLKPDVEIHLPLIVTTETLEKVEEDSVKKAKSPLLKSIALNRMILSEGSFKLIRNDVVLASSNEIGFLAKEINLVRNSKDEPIGYTYGEVKVTLSNIKLHSETGLYDMSLAKFSIDKRDSSVLLNGFKMIPKFEKSECVNKFKFQTDRFDIKIGSILISGIGYRRLLNGEPLEISKVLIDSIYADLFRDKMVPFDLNRFPLFYNESFLKIPVPIILDTVKVVNSMVMYNELAEGKTEIGLIRLEDFCVQTYNLTNIVKDDSVDQVMKIDIQANIMGEGAMNAQVILPLEGDLKRLECSGTVGTMQLSPLNAMLEPSLNIKFNAGNVTKMTFAFTGNNIVSDGWMEFLYKDVDVVILKKDPGKEWGFASLMANAMTNSNNPESGKSRIKSVQIGFERDKNKGIINYIWKTLMSGMVRTILPVNKYNIETKQKQAKDTKQDDGGKKKKKPR
jgi:hypothetical protein